jgi:hypothetical protein
MARSPAKRRSAVVELEALKDRLRSGTPISGLTRETLATAPSFTSLPAALRAKVAHDAATQQLSFAGVMTPAERDQLIAVSSDGAYRAAIGRLSTRSLSDELSQLDARGVEGFIQLLEEKIARSDDLVDFGFLRVQTDLFRIRQLVLGTTAASRLAVSPALAGFAKTKSASASQQQLSKFYQSLKGRAITPAPDSTPARAAASSSRDAAAPSRAVQPSRLSLSTGALSPRASEFQVINQPKGGLSAIELAAGAGVQPRAADAITKQGTSALLESANLKAAATLDDVVGQSAVVGKALLRTSTIAERMEAPQAPEARTRRPQPSTTW